MHIYSYNIFTHIEDTYHYNKCSTITALHCATNACAVYSSDTKLVNITTELHPMWHGGYILQKKQSIHTTYKYIPAQRRAQVLPSHARKDECNKQNKHIQIHKRSTAIAF